MSATATSGQREHDKHSAALKSSAMLSEQNEGLCPPAPLTETGAEDGPLLLGRASRSHILSLRSSETATGATWENPQLALRIRRPDLEAESREPACTQEPGPSRPGAGRVTGDGAAPRSNGRKKRLPYTRTSIAHVTLSGAQTQGCTAWGSWPGSQQSGASSAPAEAQGAACPGRSLGGGWALLQHKHT